jgi:hypothetical protein
MVLFPADFQCNILAVKPRLYVGSATTLIVGYGTESRLITFSLEDAGHENTSARETSCIQLSRTLAALVVFVYPSQGAIAVADGKTLRVYDTDTGLVKHSIECPERVDQIGAVEASILL